MDPRIGTLMRDGQVVYYAFVGPDRQYVESSSVASVTATLRAADRPTPPSPWDGRQLLRAAKLDEKARRLLHRHRTQLYTASAAVVARHQAAIRRIKHLMTPFWKAEADARAGERLARMGY